MVNFTSKFTESTWDFYDTLYFLTYYFKYQAIYVPYFNEEITFEKMQKNDISQVFFCIKILQVFKDTVLRVFLMMLLDGKQKSFS